MSRQARSKRAIGRATVEKLERRTLLAQGLPFAFEKLAGMGGEITDIETSAGLAYALTPNGLAIFDVTTPNSITKRGETSLAPDAASIALAGSYAYVAAGSNGLQIVDIADPTAPRVLASFAMPPLWAGGSAPKARQVAVAGSYAYVATGSAGLQVLDVSNPSHPALIGTCQAPGMALTEGMALVGSYVYLASMPYGLQIVSIADPARPTLVGTCDTPGNASAISVAGNYAYVADDSSLQIIDISNPASPGRVGSYGMPGNALDVNVAGSYAYVAGYGEGLQVIDISNPASPSLAGTFDAATPKSVSVVGQYAYLGGITGLHVVEVSNPGSPTLAGSYSVVSQAEAVTLQGTYAFVACRDEGLRIIDISNPASPIVAGTYDTPGLALDVVASGSYAYIADGDAGLQIIDISNPAAPVLTGSLDTRGFAQSIVVTGSYAYLAGGWGLEVVDISNPASPVQVFPWGWNPSFAVMTQDVAVQGNCAYLAAYNYGLQILDITNPASPTLVGTYDPAGSLVYVRGVDVQGSYAYVAADNAGMLVLDVSDPARPQLLGSFGRGTLPYDVLVAGAYAYVTGGAAGLQMMNTRDRTSLMQVPLDGIDGGSRGVAVSGAYVYLADGSGGLQILRMCPTTFTGTDGDDSYTVRMGSDGTTVEVFENTPTSGAPTYVIGRSALTGLSFETGSGNDVVINSTDVPTTMRGGAGNDSLTGGDAADFIDGAEGNDSIAGGAGNDSIVATAGTDTVVSGPGADRVVADLGGAFTPDAEDIVSPATPLLLGGGRIRRFVDADGDVVLVRLSGHGTGEVHFAPGGDIATITLAATDATSVLSISVSGPNNWTTVGQIDLGAGQLRGLGASRVDLVGAGITSTAGTIGTMLLRDLRDGAGIELPGAALSLVGTSLSARNISEGSNIAFGARLNTVVLGGMGAGRFTAPSIRAMQVGWVSRASQAFDADLTLTNPGTPTTYTLGLALFRGGLDGTWHIEGRTGTVSAQTTGLSWRADFLGSVDRMNTRENLCGEIHASAMRLLTVGSDLWAATVTLGEAAPAGSPALGGLRVVRSMRNSTVRADGDIGSVVVGAMEHSHLYAGYDADTSVPAQVGDFASLRRIGKIQVTGITGQATAFSDNRIAAAEIGIISVARPDDTQDSTIATGTLGIFSAKRLVNGRLHATVLLNPADDISDGGISVDILSQDV